MINLGDVTFGLGANTEGLRAATAQLRRFGNAVEAVGNMQGRTAQLAANAMTRQESAIRRALQSVLAFQADVRRSNIEQAEQIRLIRESERAFAQYTGTLTSGVASQRDLSRATDLMNARLGQQRRAFQDLRTEDATRRMGRFGRVVRDLESASVLAVGPLSGLGARIRALGSITTRSTLQIAGFLGGMAAATIGMVKLVSGSITLEKQFEKVEAQLTAVSGSTIVAAMQIERMSKLADSLGQDITTTAVSFGKFAASTRGTVLQGGETERIFTAVSKAATVMKLSTEEVSGVFRALQQIVSKGTVQAEELRGQFAERIPGGFKLAADAMGVTTRQLGKMLERGEVLAEDLLPKLATILEEVFGPEVAHSIDSINAKQNILNNTYIKFIRTSDNLLGITDTYKGSLDSVTNALEFITRHVDTFISALGGLAGAFATLALPLMTRGFLALAGALRTATTAMLALNFAMLANPFGRILAILARVAIAVAGATAGFYAMQEVLEGSGEGVEEFTGQIDRFIARAVKMGGAYKDVIIDMSKATEIQIQNQADLTVSLLDTARGVDIMGRAIRVLKFLSRFSPGQQLLGIDDMLAEFETERMKGAKDRIKEITDRVAALRERLQTLQNLPELQIPGMGDDAGDKNKELDKASDKIREFTNELALLQRQMLAASTGNADAIPVFAAIAQAKEIIGDLNANELAQLKTQLEAAGFAGITVVDAFTDLILATEKESAELDLMVSRMKEAPLALRAANREIEQLVAHTTALREGPEALEQFEAANKRTEAIRAFKEELIKANVPFDTIIEKTDEFTSALDENARAQKEFDRMQEIAKNVEGAISRSFDRIGDAITRSFVEGSDAALEFGNIVNAVLSEIIQMIIQMTVLQPVKEGLGSLFSTGLSIFAASQTGGASSLAGLSSSFGGASAVGNLSSGGGFSFSGAALGGSGSGLSGLFAKGGAFTRGVQKFGKGGLTKGPTIFPMANGMGLMGEDGTEAVMPLFRTASGDLGVKIAGGGGGGVSVNINIHNNSNSNVRAESRSGLGGGAEIDIFVDEATARNIRSGGQTSQALQDVFGARVSPTRR